MKTCGRIHSGALMAVVTVACTPVNGVQSDWDVRGNYDIAYDNQLDIKLAIGGAVREATSTGYGGVLDFGTWNGQPLQLDLNAYCSRPEVACPSKVLWTKVSVDEKDVTESYNLHTIYVIDNMNRNLDAGQTAPTVGGVVDHTNEDRYLIGLGAGAGVSGACAALGLSFAGGRFTHAGEYTEMVTVYQDPNGAACNPDGGLSDASAVDAGGTDAGLPDAGGSDGGASDGAGTLPCNPVQVPQLTWPPGAPVDGIKEGTIFVGWAGGCAFGPVVAGAVLTIQTGYVGTRTGAFDPPPYIPVEPVAIDGGYGDSDAGLAADAGAGDTG